MAAERRRLQNLVVNLNEHKYCDGTIDKDCVDYQGTCYDLTHAVSSGSGQSQRVGGKIVLSNFQISGKIYWNWNDEVHRLNWAKHCTLRMIIYFWKDDTPATPVTLLHITQPTNASLSPFYQYNEEQRLKNYPIAGTTSCVSFNFSWTSGKWFLQRGLHLLMLLGRPLMG